VQAVGAAQRGFNLAEIALALVILGLLGSAGVVATELRASARVRGLMTQADALRAAHFGFIDRFRALPGDAPRATSDIPGAAVNGNGDGLVTTNAGVSESVAAWEHLARAGFLAGGYRYGNGTETMESAPRTPFGAAPRLASNAVYAGGGPVRLNLHLGNLVPAFSLAEVDRKVDDGAPDRGAIRFSTVGTTGEPPDAANCLTPDGRRWKVADPADSNCAVTWLLQ